MKPRFWNAVLGVLSVGNLGAVWFAAVPGEAAHAMIHATLALVFGLWAMGRMQVGAARVRADALEAANDDEFAALQDEFSDMQRALSEMQDRLDFTERLLGQARDEVRLPERPET